MDCEEQLEELKYSNKFLKEELEELREQQSFRCEAELYWKNAALYLACCPSQERGQHLQKALLSMIGQDLSRLRKLRKEWQEKGQAIMPLKDGNIDFDRMK